MSSLGNWSTVLDQNWQTISRGNDMKFSFLVESFKRDFQAQDIIKDRKNKLPGKKMYKNKVKFQDEQWNSATEVRTPNILLS